jgi:CheY-like chemotaxis protein
VIADREKLSAVIENLVINAIKFTPEGGRITVGAARSQATGRSTAEIRVTDTGIGIPDDQVGRIFNRFHQVDGSSTRRFGGVGLGLAIVKSILEAHGSTITVESKPGKGTAFRFALPVVEKSEPKAVEDRSRERGEPALVLVVHDDADQARTIRGFLEAEGLVVLAAAAAASAATLALERHPDLILLDPALPDRAGLERTLKATPATSRIPLLVLSAAGDTRRKLTLGASESLTKPADGQAVVSAVSRLLAGVAEREPTVLVVADDPAGAALIRDTLRAEGFHTLIAHGAAPAIEAIAGKRPDLIVLDLMMPEMAGFQVLESLGRDPANATIPMLLLTARAESADGERRVAAAPRRSTTTPVDAGSLLAEVRRHLGIREREGARRAIL